MNNNFNSISDKELEQVAGGMSEIDEAILNGTVMGHIYNAYWEVQKTKNDRLLTMIPYLQMKCKNREYAEIVSVISSLLPVGVYDSSDKAAYDSLKKAKEAIEESGILKA